MTKRALLWFTNDLRLDDNLLLSWSIEHEAEICALFTKSKPSHDSCSNHQMSFYEQSVLDILSKLNSRGIKCYFLKTFHLSAIKSFCENNNIQFIVTSAVFNSRDLAFQDSLQKAILPAQLITLNHTTLFNLRDLPFQIEKMPLVFSEFKKQVMTNELNPVSPQTINLSALKPAIIEKCFSADDNLTELVQTKRIFAFDLKAGEEAALRHLQEYFYYSHAILHYKETRNGMVDKLDSSKLSPYLGLGSLSVRRVFQELQNVEKELGKNESTEWFYLELLWRDYFKFLSLRIKDQLFSKNGISKSPKTWNQDNELVDRWKDAQTESDFVNANMTELKQTGWMSNRGRQNVASYLAKTLNVDWTLGAKYFEDQLIDVDIESNWGNWLYLAGVGTDPRDRVFNVNRQAELYDAGFRYRNMWLKSKSGTIP